MKLRQDLLELSLNALTAIANAGFVKRAQKDLAAGAGPTLTQSGSLDILAEFSDGTLTRLAATQGLHDADCNCSAAGMCRHKVMLVLAYQAQHQAATTSTSDGATPPAAASYWSPADFSDELIQQCFSASVRDQAAKLCQTTCQAQVLPARLQADGLSYSEPAVQLAMNHVRFFSRSSPANARCDCQQASGCSHIVLALWAFRQATQQLGADGLAQSTSCNLELRPAGGVSMASDAASGTSSGAEQPLTTAAAQQAQADLEAFLWRLWQHGSGQNLTILEIHYQDLLMQLQQLGWTWFALNLQAIWQQVLAQAARSSRYDGLLLLSLISQCKNRLSVANFLAQQADPRLPLRQLLGIGQAGEVALDSLRLISLGAEFWYDQAQIGASVVLADSDTQMISVLEKSWPLNPGEVLNAELILNKRLANFPLRQLAAGQIISKAAKRRANGQLELSSSQRLSSILPLSAKSWEHLREPLKWQDLAALQVYLQQGLPEFAREFQAQASYRIISVAQLELIQSYWLGAEQTLRLDWQDAAGLILRIAIRHSSLSDTAIDQAALALNGEFGELQGFAGPVELRGGHLFMEARSLMCAERALVFAVPLANASPAKLRDLGAAPELRTDCLQQTRQELALLLRGGLQSSNHHARRRLAETIDTLQAQAYSHLALALQKLLKLLDKNSAEQADFLIQVAELDALLSALQSQANS